MPTAAPGLEGETGPGRLAGTRVRGRAGRGRRDMAETSGGRVLVTGGAGFIGSHLVEALLARGDRVRVVDNLSTGHRSNLAHLGGAVEWIEGDLADFEVCRRAADGVGGVLHEAAIPSVPRSVAEPLQSHASGPTATIHLLEAARQAGVRRFVFAASSSAYG